VYSAPYEFGIITLKKEVLNGFWAVTEAASFVTIPVTVGKVVLG